MATPTANYGFVKDAPTQLYDVAVVNANLDAIDQAIKDRETGTASVDAGYKAGDAALDGRVDILENKMYSTPLTPMCRITQTAKQSIPTNEWRVWDMASSAETIESVAGMGDSRNLDRMVMKIPGWYILSFRACWDNDGTGMRAAAIGRQNTAGSGKGPVIAEDYRNAVSSSYHTIHIVTSAPEKFTANQWAYAQVYHGSGKTISLDTNNGMYSWFQATWVAGL